MAEQNPSVPSDSDVQRILSTIKQVESSGDYGAKAKGSSASGAYQFIDDTWQRSTKRYGIGAEYKTAADAPPEVQDAVAARAVRDILGQVGGDVTKVPMVWYTGNPQGRMTEAAIKANQGQTADMYQQKWLAVFNQGRPTQAASTKVAQAPTTTLGTRITAQVPGAKQAGVQVAAAFNPSDLPSSYTSALALNYLADTDPEGVTMGKVNEMLADMMEEGGGASRPTGGKILQQFAQAKSVDPFQFVLQPEEPKQVQQRVIPKMPKMMADGGLATKALAANRPTLTKTDYDWLQARQKEFQNYNTQVDEYQKAIDAYNAKVEAYNAAQGEGVTHPGEFTTVAPTAPSTTEEQLQAYQTAAQNRAKRYYVARATGLESLVNPQKYNLSGMSFSFEKGGEVQSPGVSEEDKLRSFLDKTVGGLNYDIDPLEARLVRKQRGYEGRVSLPIAGVTPYADINPGGGVRPTEVGVTYGNMGPQGGFQVGYSQPMGGPQQIPPRITGQYRQQLDRNSAIEAGGYYMPLPGAPDVYGANVRYTRRFEKGGDVNANPADVAEQMTVGTLPEDQGTSILDKYLAFRQRNIVRRPGIFGPLGPIVGNYIFEKGYLPPTVHEFLGYAPPGDVWDPEGLKKMYGQEQVVKRQFGSPEEGEVAAQQMTVGTLPEGQRPAGQVFRDIGRDVVRGMQYLPYDLLGGPVDIATMVMRPFGYNVEKPIGGSEWLIEKSRQAGIADQPTGSAAETATRIGMGFVNPAAVARQIPKGIAALEKGVEKMTLPAFRQITGNPNATKEEMMDFVLNQKSILQAGAPAATRPGGSLMYGDEVGKDLIELARTNKGSNEEAIVNFAPKIAKYMEQQYSTPNDPLFIATLEGRFKPNSFYTPNNVFHDLAKPIAQITGKPLRENDTLTIEHINELLKLSKEGNEEARKIVARGVDRSMYTVGQMTVQQSVDQLKNTDTFNSTVKRLGELFDLKAAPEFGAKENIEPIVTAFVRQQGFPERPMEEKAFPVINYVFSRAQRELAEYAVSQQTRYPQFQYPVSISTLQAYEVPEFERVLTPAMREEVKRGKPIYKFTGPFRKAFDVNDVFDFMSETDPQKWSKMSAPELIIAASSRDPAKITNPTTIARRADEGLPLTPEQARIGTQAFMPVKSPTLGNGAEWREITDKFGLRVEGGLMQHCLKRDSAGYCNRLLSKESRYFTLRDADGMPYVSIEVSKPLGLENKDVPFNVVRQIKGRHNERSVPLYGEEITDFLVRWQKEIGKELKVAENRDYVPSEFKPQNFGMTAPDGMAKGGMVDKPLYDRAV